MNKLSIFIFLIILCSCSTYHYISIETINPAEITFSKDMRRLLIVNNALPQDDVPFESTLRRLPESFTISSDSTAFDFCRTLGEALADFQGFDDVRLLEGSLRKDLSLLSASALTYEKIELLCDEHESDIVISLDCLLYKINEDERNVFGFQMQSVIDVEISGLLRIYAQGKETLMTAIILADTLSPDIWFEYHDNDIWNVLLAADQTNLLRESARYLAHEARKHFIPYWNEDIRWYYVSSQSRWKEASVYAASDKWDKASEIWNELYKRTSSWKQQARLASNLALATELTGDLGEALRYAKLSHQLMIDHSGAEDTTTKRQELYVNVLSSRITEAQKLRLQMAE